MSVSISEPLVIPHQMYKEATSIVNTEQLKSLEKTSRTQIIQLFSNLLKPLPDLLEPISEIIEVQSTEAIEGQEEDVPDPTGLPSPIKSS